MAMTYVMSSAMGPGPLAIMYGKICDVQSQHLMCWTSVTDFGAKILTQVVAAPAGDLRRSGDLGICLLLKG